LISPVDGQEPGELKSAPVSMVSAAAADCPRSALFPALVRSVAPSVPSSLLEVLFDVLVDAPGRWF